MFKGEVVETFTVTGRGTVVVVTIAEGTARVGDKAKSGTWTGQVSGIEMINYATTPTPQQLASVGLLVDGKKDEFEAGSLFQAWPKDD